MSTASCASPSRLLIVGTGDIAQRALPQLCSKYRVLAMARTRVRSAALSAFGVAPLLADLDRPESLTQLPDTELLLYAAPPQPAGLRDERLRTLLAALERGEGRARRMLPRRVVYISTSGVYGDCGGEQVEESRQPRPKTDRARRRCDAETAVAEWCVKHAAACVILRAPGIYGGERLPLERLRRGIPVLVREHDVYTNHIHADDLAAICVAALDETAPAGVYNTVDDSEIRMGDWMDLVADAFGLPRPPRVGLGEASERIPAASLSFMTESRRLSNQRLKRDLGYALRYPTVADGVHAAAARLQAG